MKLKIEGWVEIRQGDRIIVAARNHIVRCGAQLLMKFLDESDSIGGPKRNELIWLGTDTTTKTTWDMADLAAKIDVANDIRDTHVSETDTRWDWIISATWAAGRITQTVGEVGLFLWDDKASEFVLFSRLSAADGDFTDFTPDSNLALTVTWTIRISFD